MDFILCPICKQSLMKKEENYVCSSCSKPFPIKENIPMLVPDIEKHLQFINKQIKEKEKWYNSDQIHSYDKGPYRFHLRKRIEYVKNVLREYVKSDRSKKNLDLGCGDGANLRWLANFSNNLCGTDYNFLRLLRAKKNMTKEGIQVKFFLTEIMSLPFEENSFDIIFFNHVIEHIKDDLQALRNIYKITKKGGLVIIGTPNEGALFWKFAYWIEPRIKRQTDHVNFYTAKSFMNLAKKAGFEVKHVEHIGWGIPVWSLDMRVRGNKKLDGFFEHIGKSLFKKNATSLYIILEK